MPNQRQRTIILGAGAALVALMVVFALTETWQGESEQGRPVLETVWQDETESRLRLISAQSALGEGAGNVNVTLGLDLELTKGWKTYWRNSGDSGFAPQFDWSASQNVKDLEIVWPAPQVFEEAGERYYGYKDHVLWPLRVTAADPSHPAHLVLTLNYGVCADVCVPARAFIDLEIPAGTAQTTQHAALIAEAEARTPRTLSELGFNPVLALSNVENSSGKLQVTLGNGGFKPSFVIVTGGAGSYFSGSKPLGDDGFSVTLDHADPHALVGSTVNLVVLSAEGEAAEGNFPIQ